VSNTIAKLAAGLLLALGLVIGGAGAAGAQDGGTSLTIHQRLCGDDYQGGSPWDECHDVLVDDSYEFSISGPVNATDSTDAATGNVTFDGLTAGTYDVVGGVPGEFSVKEVYCSDSNTGEVLPVTATTNGFAVGVADGAAVVCDVYEHPVDLSGEPDPDDDGDDDGDDDEPVTELPNTGAGMVASGANGIALLLTALGAGASGLALRRRSIMS
jgi:hypothetical protein